MKSDNILVGDIGGTKAIFAIVDPAGNLHDLKFIKKYWSNEYDGLESILDDYLDHIPSKIMSACLAVAGPIDGRQAIITNLPWTINSDKIIKKFDLDSLEIINDLEAIAFAIPTLNSNDVITIHEGEEVKNGTIAVIAPGTGLGEAYLTFNNGKYYAQASEGAHASFSPINAEQIQLLEFFQKQGYEHVSFERVCSGAVGIPNLYDFVRQTFEYEEPTIFKEKLINADDITPLIIEAAQKQPEDYKSCKKVLDLFCSILAVETGNLALKVLSKGGIYLAGGISLKIINQLKNSQFATTLQNKGRFSKLLKQMPIKIIVNPNVGLIGAVQHYK